MTLKELQYVTTIAEAGSISKAAEKLYIAQPSLSYTLQKIEAELGVELFKRTASGLKSTIAGEYYLKTAYNILNEYKQMEIKLSWFNEMKAGRLVVGTTAFLGTVVLPPILQAFNKLYPDIEVSIMEDVSQQLESAIIKGEVDVGIIHMPLATNSIKFKALVKEPFLLAVPPDSPLNDMSHIKTINGEKYLDIRLTHHRNYILTHPDQRTRQRSDAILANAGVTPKIRYLTKSIETATRLSGAGLGFTLVPYHYSHLFNQASMPNFYFIEEEYEPYWQLVVCCSKGISLSKPAEELINICNELLPCMYMGKKSFCTGTEGENANPTAE